MSIDSLTLWGSPHSLYTGKVRSYLIKKGLPFVEQTPAHPRFGAHVLPAVGHMVVPVLETADGALVQDSTDIIEFLEARFPDRSMIPAAPLQRCVAQLVDAFGSEGLLATAMHYRWSYRAQQEHFLRAEFGRAVHHGPDREERLAAGAALMDYFNGFLPPLGVTPATIPAIEQAYAELLDALDRHFQAHPYALGGFPCIADFGLMAPLFAHLARDPVPASLMKTRAPNVYRWTERMNLAAIADGEFPDSTGRWLDDDAIPPTLEPVLSLIFRDWGPQWIADAALFNRWIEADPAMPAGEPVHIDATRSVHPTLGVVSAPLRGVTMTRASAPHGLWLLSKALDSRAAMAGPSAEGLGALLGRTGGDAVMGIRLARRMGRERNILVLR